MSVYSSFSSNASLPPSPSLNTYLFLQNCLRSTVGAVIVTAFTITSILVLLPVCILVLYMGLQRWQQRSSKTMSHSEIFTFHIVVTELLSIIGFILSCCSIHTGLPQMLTVGILLFVFNINGQMLFHLVTCVDRYLAVVHPITYLGLRKAKGIRIRNITIGCVWLLCCAFSGFMLTAEKKSLNITLYFLMTFVGLVVSFCSLSVLHVLNRPGLGERVGVQARVDKSKLRAFYTIMVILGMLLFRFLGSIIFTALYTSPQVGETEKCGMWLTVVWFGLPSSLVLPLLFLQRAGKLCCMNINQEKNKITVS